MCRGARNLERGEEAEQNPGRERDDNREGQRHQIDARISQPRERLSGHRREQRDADPSQRHSDGGSDQRQHDALGQHLPNQAAAAGAERGADANLPLSRRRPHQQEICHVRARDEEHQHDRPHEHHERRPDVSDMFLEQRVDEHTIAELRAWGLARLDDHDTRAISERVWPSVSPGLIRAMTSRLTAALRRC